MTIVGVESMMMGDFEEAVMDAREWKAKCRKLEAELAALKSAPVVMPDQKQYHDYLPLFDKGYSTGYNDALREIKASLNRSKT